VRRAACRGSGRASMLENNPMLIKSQTVLCLLALLGPLALGLPASADEAAIDRRLAQMSLEQKVGQLFMVSFRGRELNGRTRGFIERVHPGGVLLYQTNTATPESVARLTNKLQRLATEQAGGVGLLLAIDFEGGTVTRFFAGRGFTKFPPALLVGATGTPAYAGRLARAAAEELRAVGINTNLAPVADLASDPKNRLIRLRAYGQEPETVARFVAAAVRASQRAGVIAVAKHFPGHGASGLDSHRDLPVIERDLAGLETADLVPFDRAVRAGVGAVMTAHVWYPKLEPHKGRPASLSKAVVTDLLRERLGFDGVVMTDALDMAAVGRNHSLAEAVRLAVDAGVDLIAFGAALSMMSQRQAIDSLLTAVRNGAVSEARIDVSVKRLLRLKARFGFLDPVPVAAGRSGRDLNVRAHAKLVDEVVRKGITQVRDRGGLLPIKTGARVAFVVDERVAKNVTACVERFPSAKLVEVPREPEEAHIFRATEAAFETKVLVVISKNALGRSVWRKLLQELPADRMVLVAAGLPDDLVLVPDSGVGFATYSAQEAVMEALCDVLMGRRVAKGRLPVQFGR
jgi:beta-N-acetylhexosaminidase